MDEFDRLADLEAEIYRQGALTGNALGRAEGFAEGETLGHSKGYALASEVGFYLGTLEAILKTCEVLELDNTSSKEEIGSTDSASMAKNSVILTEKLKKTIESVRALALVLDEEGVLKADVTDELHTIRSKFKLICTQLGLKMRFTGTTVDKVAEDQIPAGMPSVEF